MNLERIRHFPQEFTNFVIRPEKPEVKAIFRAADHHAKRIGELFALSRNPLHLRDVDILVLSFLVKRNLAIRLADNPSLDPSLQPFANLRFESEGLLNSIADGLNQEYARWVQKSTFGVLGPSTIKEGLTPLEEIATILNDGYLRNLPDDGEIREIPQDCKNHVDDYWGVYYQHHFQLETASQNPPGGTEGLVSKLYELSRKHPALAGMLAIALIGAVVMFNSETDQESSSPIPRASVQPYQENFSLDKLFDGADAIYTGLIEINKGVNVRRSTDPNASNAVSWESIKKVNGVDVSGIQTFKVLNATIKYGQNPSSVGRDSPWMTVRIEKDNGIFGREEITVHISLSPETSEFVNWQGGSFQSVLERDLRQPIGVVIPVGDSASK